MTLNELIAQQELSGGLIMNFITNLKKMGQEKLTSQLYHSRMQLLESYWDRFLNRHESVATLADFSSSAYCQEDYFSKVEDSYVTARAYISERVAKGPLLSDLPRDSQTTSTMAMSKLPKFILPVFSGDYLEWESFKDLFLNAVHNNKNFSDATRLQYLLAQVSGDAAELISDIKITDHNYSIAWDTLKQRYDNPRLLTKHHFRHILTTTPLNKESAESLRKLLDRMNRTRRALQNLERPVDQWDDWFVHLTVDLLPPLTCRDWETSIGKQSTVPTWDELADFLTGRIQSLEALQPQNPGPRTVPSPASNVFQKKLRANLVQAAKNSSLGCSVCGESHYIGYCKNFKGQTPQQRRDTASRLNLCMNCLRKHSISECSSPHRCSICKAQHHTLLHLDALTPPSNARTAPLAALSANVSLNQTLLATALVRVHASNGRTTIVRALLDQGSEATFISENLVQFLRLPRCKVTVPIMGMGASNCGTAKSMVRIQLTSLLEDSGTTLAANAYVLPSLFKAFQPRRVDANRWKHLHHLHLSDSLAQVPWKIELVIGADLYGYALLDGLVKGPPGTPVAQQTVFGWVLSGTVDGTPKDPFYSINTLHCCVDLSLSKDLQRFWEIEEVPSAKLLTPEEEYCEEHFRATHSRDTRGKFIVRLPRRSDISLGDSRTAALNSFQRTERRRHSNPTLSLAYQKFMDEYLDLGHMQLAPKDVASNESFYLPHHAVWKKEGTNSKIRVVFNASARSTSGHSLNDALLPGPKLQQDLSHILLRWRKYPIVFSADIVKMFRQIWVHPADQPLQRIFWRNSVDEPLEEFQLQTVTYGTTCAPFLAIRCLLQLASENTLRFPQASSVIRQQMYVDDILTGADTLEEALELKVQLESLLTAGGFELAKWSSNVQDLAPNVACNHFSQDGSVKTLGIHWNPEEDAFGFQVELQDTLQINKRSILSSIAKLFDPLGWLAPVLITAKILIQDLWSVKSDWDAPLPANLEEAWLIYYHGLRHVQDVKIPRWIQLQTNASCELHGFCDASQRAYAACVYLRVEVAAGIFCTHLLVAKTKVAPLKVISLPRLELSGAVLLIRLLKNTSEALQLLSPPCIHAWTDSQVVLHWINAVPARWKCFVANRVSEIHQTLPQVSWHHVSSSDNPADPASRGIPAESIRNLTLWWHGPTWLSQPTTSWPLSTPAPFSPDALNEANPRVQSFNVRVMEPWTLLERYSSLNRLLRVTSWLFRFVSNLRNPKDCRRCEPLSVMELERSRKYWIKAVQEQHFVEEIHSLRSGNIIPRRSVLCRLHPFLDPEGILRVGGRLENASLSYDEKHPIVLPGQSTFSHLLAVDCHQKTLHGGPQLMLSQLSRTYWIIRGRNLVRKITRTCVICIRYSRKPPEPPLMGQLPSTRVTPSRPFFHTGLDYAGPLELRPSKGRGRTTCKGYIALFICMATKAIHLEAVSDCSTAAFLAAFKRFCSRRGIPATLTSDQATNFRGADAELRRLFTQASRENADLTNLLAGDGTQWNFIPPHTPHFGGLWEAGVKSVKTHLRKVIGETVLTFEELTTVLAEIEACLNSRPLTPVRSTPDDHTCLTPGHFLIGEPLKTLPEPSLLDTNLNRLTRWQLLRQISEHFWRRWSKEYVHHLQQRQKWTSPTRNLQPGDIVLLQEDHLPPSKWRLARVLRTHPGTDGYVRVVTLRTATSTFRRPTAKLCRLPIE